MTRLLSILIFIALVPACGTGRPSGASDEVSSPFAAASGVSSADGTGDNRRHRIAPLRPMTGDVEILHGDPEKAGEPFVMRIRELPGAIVPLHSHPVDEYITVVSGTWYFAVGEKWDREALKEIPAGGFAFAPKGSTMFGYSPDGAVVQVHGVGPFHIHWVNGVATLDSADASGFTFRKAERVEGRRGQGVIRQGYASGDIIQYEIAADDGTVFMENQADIRRF
jgi:quercetin dioxygenase-like cupin family protein